VPTVPVIGSKYADVDRYGKWRSLDWREIKKIGYRQGITRIEVEDIIMVRAAGCVSCGPL
jgi:hypothetical protein